MFSNESTQEYVKVYHDTAYKLAYDIILYYTYNISTISLDLRLFSFYIVQGNIIICYL